MAAARYPTSPPPLSRSAMVIGLYGALALTALLLSAGRGDADIYRLDETASGWRLALSPLVGLLLGLAVVVLSRIAVERAAWARDLHQNFRHVLGALTGREIAVLAVASAIGEELMFRGALQPWIGLWAQAAIFALLHIGPSKRFLPWTMMALAMGIALGLVAEATGDLGAPIVAHFTINFCNLRFINRVELGPLVASIEPSMESSIDA